MIQKNQQAQIRIINQEYKGKNYIHIREYYLGENDEYLPTKKGVAFIEEHLDAIVEELQALKK